MSIRTIYAISYLLVVCFTPPPTLAAFSDSHGSCKMKATALLHVTLHTLPFLFHWPQTPDFSEAKNRLLQTLTPPPRCPLISPFFPLSVQAFIGKSLCVLPILYLHMADKVPRLSLCERDIRILYVISLIEDFCFL